MDVSKGLSALIAVSANQDLGDFAYHVGNALAVSGQFNFIQADDLTTIDAQKVWMSGIVAMFTLTDRFESPHMVPQFSAAKQTNLGQAVQIAKHGGTIDP